MQARVLLSLICIAFYLYPSTVNAILSSFSCLQLDTAAAQPGGSQQYVQYRMAQAAYWTQDTRQECYAPGSAHLRLVLAFALPLTLVWSLGIPVGMALVLW